MLREIMKRPRTLPLLLVMLAGCASGGSALYRKDVGTASAGDAVSIGEQLLARKGYEIFEQDSIPFIRILTHWKPRRPFTDEAVLGITAAENRIQILARPRGQTEMGAFYNITVQIDNRVRVAGAPDWNETTNTPEFRAYADEIVNEYKRFVTNIGVRRY